MMSTGSSTRSVLMAMLCAGGVTAQFIGGKAARDALYFSNFDPKTLPAMVIGTSFVSIILVAISAKIFARLSPSTFVPALFTGSALLLLAEWALTYEVQKAAAVLVYLHISGLGPMLGSGFWLIASERFDPRTAKRRVGQIQSAGTFVGLLGVLFADRVAVTFGTAAMLPVLAALNVGCAFALRQLALPRERDQRARPPGLIPELAPAAPRTGLRVLADAPYLRHLAALVMLSTMSAMLLDYIFKVQARSTFGSGFEFRRFFVIYYSATSLITFLLQTSSSRVVLERLVLGWTAAMPSVGLIAGSVGGLFVPGITTMTIARGGESVLRGSFFRAGYELFYTPVPAAEKRAAKSIIDVGFDRLGDLLGAGVLQLVLLILPAPGGV